MTDAIAHNEPTVPVPAPSAGRPSASDKAVMALSGVGVAVMAYLTHLHYKTVPGTVCDFGANFSCEIVNKSIYSEVLGVPLAFLGMAYFLTVALLASGLVAKWVADGRRIIQAFTLFSLVFGLNLTVIEVHELGTVCLFCEASKVLMVVIMALIMIAERRRGRPVPKAWLAAAAVAGLAFVGVTRYLQVNMIGA